MVIPLPADLAAQGFVRTARRSGKLTFRSTDFTPMRMEARQNLGVLVDLTCCQGLRIALRNKDRYPDSVRVELVLVGTAPPGSPRLLLGSQLVAATGSEELTYAIPASAALRRFDEVIVRFHLAPYRARTSTKMGIDRFVLMPKI